ncbi:MAG: hypothetical protein WKF87_06530 [Chryseolinea sp.]
MAKKIITPAQYKCLINNYNQQVRKYNTEVKRNIDNYNREVKKAEQEINRGIQKYNNEVRRYNTSQVRRITTTNSLSYFNSSRTIVTINTSAEMRSTTSALATRYTDLDRFSQMNGITDPIFTDLPAQETDNSLQLYNSLAGVNSGDYMNPGSLQLSLIEQMLHPLSGELAQRWRGALFSLNPGNPDAARHFCTSVREVFIQIIDLRAPDDQVKLMNPNCELYNGRPVRREKINFLLRRGNMLNGLLSNFIDADVTNVLTLFGDLNKGTHGPTGRYDIQQLLKIKKRAEDSIAFLIALT